MLLARRQRQHEAALATGVDGLSDEATGEVSDELVATGEQAESGPAIRERQAETLTLADRDVHTRRTGRLEDRQRQGLGRALMKHAQDQWRNRQVKRAFLEVRRQNQAARSLYTRMGWIETGVRRNYYRDGEDAVLYLLELT